MKKMFIILAVFLFFHLGLLSQVRLNGSIENVSTINVGNDIVDFNNASQLKLLFNYNSESAWRLFSDVRLTTYYGYDDISSEGFSFVDKNGNYALGLDVSRMYLKAHFNSASFTLGRDYLSFGTPFIFNTLEWTKNFSLIDPTQTKPAMNLFSFTLPVGSYGKFQSFVGGNNEWDGVLSGSELVLGTTGFEGGFVYQYKGRNTNTVGLFFKADVFVSIGGSYAFHVNNLLYESEKTENRHEASLFFDYSVPVGFMSLLLNQSFYYNSIGARSATDLETTLYGDYFFKSMAYSYSSVGLVIDEFTNFSIDVLVNMVDGSGAVLPRIQYSLLDNLSVDFSSGIYFGKNETEFSPSKEFIPNAIMLLSVTAAF